MTNGSGRGTISSYGNDYPTYKLDRNSTLEDHQILGSFALF